ncbi:MAG: hypothetical protein CVU53_02020 [Deltaproteobacteria bacterium HGW-Deltaproteobacteria-11]|nr:MAG: hypothetical protein CVU53_02020 [Deltaproteobacteria bacterium HGW-Deltaproteobacteria-11]
MKKLLLIVMACFFIAGCGAASRQSEFWGHSSMYQNWSHLGFSWYGYQKASIEDARKSQEQKWWGAPISADQSK